MKTVKYLIFCFLCIAFVSCQKSTGTIQKNGTLKITFQNKVKGSPMLLFTGGYTNSFGESYIITKFKYYVSHVSISGAGLTAKNDGYYLVDEGNASSLSFNLEAPESTYSTISFLLGVDSTRNVSGAQTGALDPLNDMFWTWNSGYIMAKMEGTSPQSTVVNKKVEYHIGGFAGANSVLKTPSLTIPVPAMQNIEIREGKVTEVFIDVDFDKWWQGAFDLKIASNPAVTHPGATAKNIADNYINMFKVANVINY